MNIIYLRVSKEGEGVQDIEAQKIKIIEKFNPKDPIVLQEKGSAYDLKNIHKRKQFRKLLLECFDGATITIEALFFNEKPTKKINIYVWDCERIMRNLEYSLIFLILCDLFDVTIYTYKDGKLKDNQEETPTKKMIRYMTYALQAYQGEQYSYTTGQNIRKAFVKKEGSAYSRKYGLKVGRNFTTANGDKINLSADKLALLNHNIRRMHKYYEKRNDGPYYERLMLYVQKRYGLKVSKSYVSRLRP